MHGYTQRPFEAAAPRRAELQLGRRQRHDRGSGIPASVAIKLTATWAILAATALAAVAAGCSVDVPPPNREPSPSPSRSSTGSAGPTGSSDTTEPVTTASLTVPDRLRRTLGPVSPLAALSTFRDLDLREAAMAPSLAAAPVRQALLVASFNLFSPDPAAASVGTTNLFVLTTVGNWRRVPLGDYGDFHAEPSFVLSPNGRELAVGEGNTRRVVVIDLTTGSAQGYSVPRQQPVGLRWSADGNELLFFARASAVGYRLDTRTGYVERTSYNVYNAGFDNKNDAVIEISVDDKGNGVLNRYRGNTIEKSQPLEYSRLLGRAPIQQKYVAFDHSPDRSTRATGDQPAIVVVDPQDGRLVSAIVDPRVRTDWVQTLAWVGEDHLAFARGRSGSVQVWNVTTGQLSELLTFANRGVHISLSSQVTQNLLKEGSALQ